LFEENYFGPPPLPTTVRVMLAIWCILMVLGVLPALMLTGMAFEGGHTLDAYLSLIAVWSYPPLVVIAFFFRRRKPALIWLPLITVALFMTENLVWQSGLRIKFSN
jgi:hypothetical protein